MFYKQINLFELTDKLVQRFTEKSSLTLDGSEFKFTFKREVNCYKNKIFLKLFIFDQYTTYTVFDEHYNTVDKVIDLIFANMEYDSEIDDLHDRVIDIYRINLETRLLNLTERIIKLSNSSQTKGITLTDITEDDIYVDEKYPHEHYSNGFPMMKYNVIINDQTTLSFDIPQNPNKMSEESILKAIRSSLFSANVIDKKAY